MKILKTSTGSQSIKFVPRAEESSVVFTITDKNKRTTSTVSVSVSNADGYMTVSGTFALVEGTSYFFEVKNSSGDLIYRDTVFCTDQTDYQKYTVNQGEYVTENTHDNDFIVL
tara:strand:+ start:614 stop:952 length:339 start_codon:yes stop_codon:yes gene_type:complete